MAVPFLDLSRETAVFRDRIDAAVERVLDSGIFVLGPEVEKFEEEFASYCGAQHAIGVASGTDAIAIALRAAGVEPGDEVVAPANTCVPTIAGIEQAGAVPVLADVDERNRTSTRCRWSVRSGTARALSLQCTSTAALRTWRRSGSSLATVG